MAQFSILFRSLGYPMPPNYAGNISLSEMNVRQIGRQWLRPSSGVFSRPEEERSCGGDVMGKKRRLNLGALQRCARDSCSRYCRVDQWMPRLLLVPRQMPQYLQPSAEPLLFKSFSYCRKVGTPVSPHVFAQLIASGRPENGLILCFGEGHGMMLS